MWTKLFELINLDIVELGVWPLTLMEALLIGTNRNQWMCNSACKNINVVHVCNDNTAWTTLHVHVILRLQWCTRSHIQWTVVQYSVHSTKESISSFTMIVKYWCYECSLISQQNEWQNTEYKWSFLFYRTHWGEDWSVLNSINFHNVPTSIDMNGSTVAVKQLFDYVS